MEEKKEQRPPTVEEQEKAHYADKVKRGVAAGPRKHGERTADHGMGSPGDCHESQVPPKPVETEKDKQ